VRGTNQCKDALGTKDVKLVASSRSAAKARVVLEGSTYYKPHMST
jgi:hypothetical protein